MNAREKLDEFAEMTGMNKSELIGWSIAADFAEWYAEQVKNCSISDVVEQDKSHRKDDLEEILDKHLELRSWTKTVPKNGNLYNTLIDALNEALSIASVVNRRELLLAFCQFMHSGTYDSHNTTHSQDVDAFLESQ